MGSLYDSTITDKRMWIAILCVAMKEHGLIPGREKSFSNTSNARIMMLFGRKKLGKYFWNPVVLSRIKKNDSDFFSWVYRGVAGNGSFATRDGYIFRGGGYNGLTGKDNYKGTGERIGVNLLQNPNGIVVPEYAAAALVDFFEHAKGSVFAHEKAIGCEKIAGENWPYLYAANINAGLGKKATSKVVKRAYKNMMNHKLEMESLVDEFMGHM